MKVIAHLSAVSGQAEIPVTIPQTHTARVWEVPGFLQRKRKAGRTGLWDQGAEPLLSFGPLSHRCGFIIISLAQGSRSGLR